MTIDENKLNEMKTVGNTVIRLYQASSLAPNEILLSLTILTDSFKSAISGDQKPENVPQTAAVTSINKNATKS